MPRFDRTGPNGLGPRTGRGFGLCGYGPGRGMGHGMGHGMGYGRGYGMDYGRGYGWGYRTSITNQQEKEILNEDMNILQEEIEAIKARIKELGSKK